MYIKCYFALNGHLTTRSVFSAASHSNVHNSGKGIRGYLRGLQLRYKQAMRHMWGSLDSGFVLKSLGDVWGKKSPEEKRLRFWNTSDLMLRIFEAHFLPHSRRGHLHPLHTPSTSPPPSSSSPRSNKIHANCHRNELHLLLDALRTIPSSLPQDS
ncbi:hypothetical protein DL95DRAFT_160399 [Leptodontidium sp. 2 PMI_412]|nr:hypothetical protein DL95DRAFT_160399 [Leptodontidium sp. 2 PMI_412]